MSLLQPGPRYKSTQHAIIKAALFDVDNTLVANESSDLPTKRFKAAVDALGANVKIGLASARSLAKVAHILDYLQADGLSILSNGAQIVNNRDKSVIVEWPMGVQTCADVVAHLQSLGVQFWINDDSVDYFASDRGATIYEKQEDIWDHGSARVMVPDYTFTKPFVVVAHHVTQAQADAIKKFVAQHPDNSVTAFIGHQTDLPEGGRAYDVFIVNTHANKLTALHKVARLQHITLRDIMAVGDGRNDALLVGAVGVGVAMGNSAPETLAVATYIAPRREDDGAAVALEFAKQHLA